MQLGLSCGKNRRRSGNLNDSGPCRAEGRGTGRPGPGLQPSGFGSELLQPVAQSAQNASGLTDANLTFCGLAVDAQDQLYMVDAGLNEVRRFSPDGQLTAAWKLPDYFGPARGCIAAGAGRVFVGDARNVIHVYGSNGTVQADWTRPQSPRGLAVGADGLWVLQPNDIAVLDVQDGNLRVVELGTEGASRII